MTGLFRRPRGLYGDDDVPVREPLELRELPSVIEHERLAVISTALRLAEDKDRLAEEVAVVTSERDTARAVIAEVRRGLEASQYFAGVPVRDVIEGTRLLAAAYEAERGRPWSS